MSDWKKGDYFNTPSNNIYRIETLGPVNSKVHPLNKPSVICSIENAILDKFVKMSDEEIFKIRLIG